MRVITVANQKGGVGKTTTAVNLSASLAVAEKKTLLLDLDPQSNASSGVGVFQQHIQKGSQKSIYDVFIGESAVQDVILPTALEFLSVIPASQDLVGFEIEFVNEPEREFVLKKAVLNVPADFEYVIIDCPPSLGLLTVNSLAACDSVLVPLQCEYYALEGLSALMNTVGLVQKNLNPKLKVEGIVLTMFDPRNNLSRQVAKDVCEHFGHLVFQSIIPRNVRLSESPSYGKPVLLYDVHCSGAQSYFALTKEFLMRQNPLHGQVAQS